MRTHRQHVLLSLIGLLVIALTGCTFSADPANSMLRIYNTSDTSLDRLVVLFPEDEIDFGSVPAGATTGYQRVPRGVYGYAAYRITLDRQTITQGVEDWLGEQPLPGRAFTYAITVDPQQPIMIIESEVQQDQ